MKVRGLPLGIQSGEEYAETTFQLGRGMGQTIFDGARAFAGGELRDDACVLLARRQ